MSAFAVGVPCDINGFHPSTTSSNIPENPQSLIVSSDMQQVKPVPLTKRRIKPPTDPLRPVNPDNACTLRLTEASGTELAGTYSTGLATRSKGVYNPKAFIPHAASRRQTFVHCVRFPVAATRRCMGRVSVPFWGYTLSRPLPVVALVGRYPTN